MISATLTNAGDFVKIEWTKGLLYVKKLTGYAEDIKGIGVLKREFRWSYDRNIRSSWVELTDKNLEMVRINSNLEVWVDMRYTLLAGGPISIIDAAIKIEQEFPDGFEDKFYGYTPQTVCGECGNISSITKFENFSFNPYAVNAGVNLYKSLSYTINQLFGHFVEYARAVPMSIGRDVTLKEWTLFDVDDPKCVKILVPNNEFPDNKSNYNTFGIDFELPFEVHIDKQYFEDMFGVGSGPQKRDIVFFSLTNRIYEVQSSYLFRDFMQKPVYWKVNLMKYQPKANRYEPMDLQEKLDDISWNIEERFGEELKNDELKKTKPQQYDPKIGSSQYDPTRLFIDDNLNIVENKLQNYYTVISNTYYDLRSIYNSLDIKDAVKYRELVEFKSNEDRAFCAWFYDMDSKVPMPKDLILTLSLTGSTTFGPTVAFTINANRNYQIGDLIKITRQNGLVSYGKIITVNSNSSFIVQLDNDVYNYLQAQYPSWISQSSFYAEKTSEKILFNGYDNITMEGWKITLTANRYIKLYLNEKVTIFILPETLIINQWYAIFLNISNTFEQISLDIWTRKWSETNPSANQSTSLENIYSKSINGILATDYSIIDGVDKNYRLTSGELSITNIRLLSNIETDQMNQINILNQNIVQDSHLAVIIDNAIQRLKLPWIAKTK